MTRGWVVTSNIDTGATPQAGDVAFASWEEAGAITTSDTFAAKSGEMVIGRFMSSKDADGYAKVYVNLPNTHGE